MSQRETDTTTVVAGIAAIVIIVVSGCVLGYDHTLMKLGIAAIAGLAGFSIRGLVRWQ